MYSNKRSIGVLVLIAAMLLCSCGGSKKSPLTYKKITPVYGMIRSVVSTTGTIQPRNRLELKPPISGRIDSVLVHEGDHVKKGQTLVWMSSTERAALLDAARAQGADAVKYWEEVYKPTPLLAPISGEVIDRTLEPGQTVSQTTPIVVLSDSLIVKADVDETDIGKVKVGQKVEITLDAYPDQIIPGIVEHIAYESTIVNNVTIYQVDIRASRNPGTFRSGMGANVAIVTTKRDHALLLPMDAVVYEKGTAYVLVPGATSGRQTKKPVAVGLSDEKNVEITSGLDSTTEVLLPSTEVKVPRKTSSGANPFLPSRRPGARR